MTTTTKQAIYRKTVIIGRGPTKNASEAGEVSIDIEIRDTDKGPELSMCGNVWRNDRRDILSGGQNIDHIADDIATWSIPREQFTRMQEVWKAWHLNGMKAGCEHQRAEGWADRPIDPTKPTNTYGKHFAGQRQDSWNMLAWVSRKEHPEGLLSHPCPTCGYKYGTAWLHDALPDAIVAEVRSW